MLLVSGRVGPFQIPIEVVIKLLPTFTPAKGRDETHEINRTTKKHHLNNQSI